MGDMQLMSVDGYEFQLTIAIATLNCGPHLERLLTAFNQQSLSRDSYEVILVDGGSTDNTREVGERFGCRVLLRPQADPVKAKHIAFFEARGRYLMYVDHDEVPVNRDSLERRLSFFAENPDVHALQGSGFLCPAGYPFINQYVNDFGDPFSFFIYRISKDQSQFIPFMKRRYKVLVENQNSVVFDFTGIQNLPLLEFTGMGTVLDLSFFRNKLGTHFKEPWSLPHFFYIMLSESKTFGILKNDPLMHYSAERLNRYVRKLTWRVRNNIYHQSTLGASGFLGRIQKHSQDLRFKKYFFLPYVFFIIPLLIDTAYLMLSRRRTGYAVHFPLSLFVALTIVWHLVLKTFGFRPQLLSYEGSKVIEE